MILYGCAQQSAPVVSLDIPSPAVITNHVVQKGETLYSIAWRYDLNVSRLAKNNRLSASTNIYPGQILNIGEEMKAAFQKEVSSLQTKLPNGYPLSADSFNLERGEKSSEKLPKKQEVEADVTKGIEVLPNLKNEKAAKQSSLKTVKNYWQWPVRGKLKAEFNVQNLQKGITIETVGRASVRAAASGKVVYAGDGLRGYGQLIIVKHNEMLLSAYAQNEKILVYEGQAIDSMEIISKLGPSGILYFEIRKDGRPVDPLDYIN
tara:strand:+ start:2391 stop:3176 length:786 start_codon:yes stop_codon:yes gene_type:complete